MKKFIALVAFSKDSKPRGGLGGKGAALVPREAKVMAILH
jgi:hypothetical protein